MSLSNYAEKKVNDKLFGGVDFTPPATYYLALATAAPTESGTFTEANYGGYARVAVANNKTNFTNAADDGDATINVAVEVRFPTLTSGTNSFTHVVLTDAASGGTVWGYSPLTTVKTYTTGDRPVFEVGKLVFKVD